MRPLALSAVLLGLASSVGVNGCDTSSAVGADAGDDAASTDVTVGGSYLPEGNPCTDPISSVYADPGDMSAKPKGAILKCAHDQDLTAAALLAAARAPDDAGGKGYQGRPFTSGARVYRVLYRTERGDANGSWGYSSALVLLPDTPRAPRSPVVVASHGSRGQGSHCAPSLLDPAAADVNGDFIHQVYSLVGLGYAVIAPDLAGYANFGAPGNPPSAYASAADVAKSTLDGARALRQLVPGSVTEQVVLVGHSQGGHTALSALSMADSYGADGVVAAVAVYSPLWLSQRSWGAIFLESTTRSFAQSVGGPVTIWYHYTHEALLDQGNFSVFVPNQLPTVTSFVQNDCWNTSYPDLEAQGTSANAFFTSSYEMSIIKGTLPGGSCQGDAVCQTWTSRMTADWPHLVGGAAKVPILVLYGSADNELTPDLMACVFNRLSADGANYQVCYDADPTVGHSGIVEVKADTVADWIAAKTLGGSASTCTSLSMTDSGVPLLTDADGGAIQCNPLESTQ
jgi:pimeloyl-ACP methyl ester carboxylesterase